MRPKILRVLLQGAEMCTPPSLREPFPTRTRRMFKALICCPSCQIARPQAGLVSDNQEEKRSEGIIMLTH